MMNASRYASFDSKFGRGIGTLRPLTVTIKESVPLKAAVRTNPLSSLAYFAVAPHALNLRTLQNVPAPTLCTPTTSFSKRACEALASFDSVMRPHVFLSFDATPPDLSSDLWFPITATRISKSECPGCALQEFS